MSQLMKLLQQKFWLYLEEKDYNDVVKDWKDYPEMKWKSN